MVNHIIALLLNETAKTVSESGYENVPYIDPTFAGVAPDGAVSQAVGALFSGVSDISGKIERVRLLVPFISSPEFSKFRDMFDVRETGWAGVMLRGTILDFYRRLNQGGMGFVHDIVSSPSTNRVFTNTGDAGRDGALLELRSRFNASGESALRFTAVLYAMAIHLDYAYEKSIKPTF